ncbi:reverse transcriptase, partial [Phytophthora palmivora]
MVYPIPLINDLLEDLDKVLWYCSLDMTSGFSVVTMTDRARAISAFITPFGLFEWNQADDPDKPTLCDRVDALLEACDRWNLSISVVKSFWGMNKVEYLGHSVSKDGLEANPKGLEALTDLAFPGSLRSMQSFLGSLNYYSRFIEDYAIYAAVLYELREVDFAAMSKDEVRIQIKRSMEPKELDQRDLKEDPGLDLTLKPTETSDPGRLDGEQ